MRTILTIVAIALLVAVLAGYHFFQQITFQPDWYTTGSHTAQPGTNRDPLSDSKPDSRITYTPNMSPEAAQHLSRLYDHFNLNDSPENGESIQQHVLDPPLGSKRILTQTEASLSPENSDSEIGSDPPVSICIQQPVLQELRQNWNSWTRDQGGLTLQAAELIPFSQALVSRLTGLPIHQIIRAHQVAVTPEKITSETIVNLEAIPVELIPPDARTFVSWIRSVAPKKVTEELYLKLDLYPALVGNHYLLTDQSLLTVGRKTWRINELGEQLGLSAEISLSDLPFRSFELHHGWLTLKQ